MDGEMWPVDFVRSQRSEMLVEVHRRTGVAVEDLRRFAREERTFTAEQAKALNFIDEIASGIPPMANQMKGNMTTEGESGEKMA